MKTIKIRDTIGWHTTSKDFSNEFQPALDSGEEIEIHINSPGGSVYQGWEIFNEIRMATSKGADVSTYNMGLAASMASAIFLAPPKDSRFMAENSMAMIHNPKGLAFGEKKDMEKEMEVLGKIEDLLSKMYAKETDSNQEYMKALMAKTTWMKPDEAKKEGFITNIVDGRDDVEDVKVVGMDKSAFSNAPSNCGFSLCFADKERNIKTDESISDLTKTNNSQIREKIWMNCLKN